MQYWTRRRQLSFAAHITFVAVPFVCSTVSALLFWHQWFASWVAAGVLVGVIEIMALSSFVLYVARVEWPLTWLRHMLPFLSVVPLGWELYHVLLPNSGSWVAFVLSAVISAWFVFVAFVLFRSLERLFVDPVEAAGELMHERLDVVRTVVGQLMTANQEVSVFVREWTGQPNITLTAPNTPSVPALTDTDSQPDIVRWHDTEGLSFEEIGQRLNITRSSAYARYQRCKTRMS